MGSDVQPGGGDLSYMHGEIVVNWVARKISDKLGFDNPIGIGIMNWNHDIVVGVVLDNYRVESNSICVSLAITGKKAFTRRFIKNVFRTIFNDIGVNRVSAMIEHDNVKSIRAIEALGFVREGVMREQSYNMKDLVVYGMLNRECRWL